MNKYQNEAGVWIGPKDKNGYPIYGTTYNVILTDNDGNVIDRWEVDSELDLPEAEEINQTILNS
jgi:predicted NBD/HSP70 family sugar kinase